MNAPDMDPLMKTMWWCRFERILDAALQLIQLHGLHAMSQAKVCEMAGVRHSHLTYYFPTRVKLLKGKWSCGAETVLALLDGPEDKRAGSLGALRTALSGCQQSGLSRMMVAVYVVSDEEPSLRPWMDKFQMNGLQRVKRALEAIGINPPQRAVEAFLACLIGTLSTTTLRPANARAKRSKAVIRHAFDQMVAASKGGSGSQSGKFRQVESANRPALRRWRQAK